jgi:hypothetical protein
VCARRDRQQIRKFEKIAGGIELQRESATAFRWRKCYPNNMEPEGNSFRELFLMSLGDDGTLNTLYETPKGMNVELWTYFLRALDQVQSGPKLDEYARGSKVVKEFGEIGAQVLHQALRLRFGPSERRGAINSRRFFEVFPSSELRIVPKRDVGGAYSSWL